LKAHNDRLYEQGQDKLRNEDRSFAWEQTKHWNSMQSPPPTKDDFNTKFNELYARFAKARGPPTPSPKIESFWEFIGLVAVGKYVKDGNAPAGAKLKTGDEVVKEAVNKLLAKMKSVKGSSSQGTRDRSSRNLNGSGSSYPPV
jgi:hypothetical protein